MLENEIKDKPIEKKVASTVTGKKGKKNPSPISNPFMQILNGEFLSKEFVVKNLGFIFYFILLLIFLVGKGYYDKRLTKKVDTSQKELDELTGDYVAKKAQLEEETKRVTLVRELAPRGLKETVNPTKVIRVKAK
jgi:hypothetical protein